MNADWEETKMATVRKQWDPTALTGYADVTRVCQALQNTDEGAD